MAILFALTLFFGSALVFLVQPLYGKMVLPLLGGTPAVWNGCMVFFQAGLLAGYAYAHYGSTRLGVQSHAVVHILLILSPLALLFVLADSAWDWNLVRLPGGSPSSQDEPVFWLWQNLLLGIGISYTLVSAGAPLLQKWFSETGHRGAGNPYVFYVASNVGSMLALLAYPFVIEPNWTLSEQGTLWTAGYVVLAGMTVICACLLLRSSQAATTADVAVEPTPARTAAKAGRTALESRPTLDAVTRLRWIALALVPAALLLSVTTYLTTDIAPIPLLWLVPLAIYLLTFILVFANRPLLSQEMLNYWMPLVVLVVVLVMVREAQQPLPLVLAIHVVGFFWIAMVCHGELARSRPDPSRLTEFYLCLAAGGVLGGLVVALVAPLMFSSLLEYPLMLILACVLLGTQAGSPTRENNQEQSARLKVKSFFIDLAIWMALFGLGTAALAAISLYLATGSGQVRVVVVFAIPLVLCYLLKSRPARFGAAVAGILIGGSWLPGEYGKTIYRTRSFFGVHRVTEDAERRYRFLVHGNTKHSQQSLDPKRQDEPLMYFTRRGPIGQVFKAFKEDERLNRAALIGLGAGAIACFAEPGQKWTFFEIDPAVIRIAQDPKLFTYLQNARGDVGVIAGDGRLRLSEQKEKFGILVVDAFTSDAIPMHLLTREALAIYRERLTPDGLMAFHISNEYVDLEPVLANLAANATPPMSCLIQRDLSVSEHDKGQGKAPSVWMVLTNRKEDAEKLLQDLGRRWQRARLDPALPVWTDDFSNLLSVFRPGVARD